MEVGRGGGGCAMDPVSGEDFLMESIVLLICRALRVDLLLLFNSVINKIKRRKYSRRIKTY